MKAKKTNPRNRPATEADVKRAFHLGYDEALKIVLFITLYTLVDKHGADVETVTRFRDNFNYTLDSIDRGYLKWEHIRDVLGEEYGIIVDLH